MWAKAALAASVAAVLWLLYASAGDALNRGGAFPEGSSLSADFNGTGVLYESLRRLDDWQVRRTFRPAKELPAAAETLVIVGLRGSRLSSLDPHVRRWTAAGARVVVGYAGKANKSSWLGLPLNRDPAEQPLGTGSLVVAPAEMLENLAMVEEDGAAQALAILGPGRRVNFAEGVIGVEEPGGIMTLLRRAGFGPAILLALVAVVLYLWRAATALLPERPGLAERAEPAGGRDALARLFRRHIGAGELLTVCLAEWRAAAPLLPRWQAARAEAAAAAAAGARPLDGYRKIQEVIKERPKL